MKFINFLPSWIQKPRWIRIRIHNTVLKKKMCFNLVNYGTVPVPVLNGTVFVSIFFTRVFLIPREECSRCPEGEDQDVATAHRAAHSQRQDTNQYSRIFFILCWNDFLKRMPIEWFICGEFWGRIACVLDWLIKQWAMTIIVQGVLEKRNFWQSRKIC